MKNISLLVCSLSFAFVLTVRASEGDGIMQIKENYKSILIPSYENPDSLLADLVKIKPETEMSDQAVVELHQRYPFDLRKIEAYLARQAKDGAWSDINYADTKRSGWEPKLHAERVLELSKLYYSPATPYFRSERIRRAIHLALKYWFAEKPVCLNWWYNQIGVPKTLGAAFVLLEEELDSAEKAAAIEVMRNAGFGMTGQNKVWLAGNVLVRALLQDDEELARAARDTIASEIVLGRKEGIKDDWSFHQHGSQQQFGNYGLSFVSGMSFFHRLFRGTAYEFGRAELDILASLVNEGYRWIIWNRHMDVSSLGRQLFHHAQLHKAYSLAFAAADLDLSGFPAAGGNTPVGHKHFDDSDYTVHRSVGWMASVKMASERVIGTELINEDNLKGYYMADGATYYYVRGDEYLDVFPFWDWRKIPGITAYEDTDSIPVVRGGRGRNATCRVGGLTAGSCGMTAMELDRDGLKAYKAWLFTDCYVLCLGGDIRSDSALNVTTSVEQRMARGGLYVLDGGAWKEVRGDRSFAQDDLRFFHDRTGYVVWGGTPCVAQAERRVGRWCDFMKMYRPATVEGEVVSLHLSHGIRPVQGGYRYLVLPASSRDAVSGFDAGSVRVIRNDSSAQVVQAAGAGKGYWIAAYERLALDIDGERFVPEVPGIYYVEKTVQGLAVCRKSPFRMPEAE